MDRVQQRWRALRTSAEGRRSVWSGIGLVGSSIAAVLTVSVAATQLGTARYGVYAGIGALVNLAAMFGALGTKEVLLQRVTRDRAELAPAWGVLLAANAVVGVPLLWLTVGVSAVLLPGRDLLAIALIALAEYVSTGLVKGPAYAWVALDRYPLVAATNILDASLRCLAACSLLIGTPDVRRLAIALAVSLGVGAVVVNLLLARDAGRPTLCWDELVHGCRVGAPFSVATISAAVQSNIDQFMLVRARLDLDAGLYAAGVRLISYSMLPQHALMSASVPEFFRRGQDSLAAALAYGRKLLAPIVVMSLGGAAIAMAGSVPLGRLFGDRFDGILPVVAALAAFPLLRMLQLVLSNALMGSARQRFVAQTQIVSAALNVAVNLPLIPWLGWRGAVISTYASELVNLGLLWVGSRRRAR